MRRPERAKPDINVTPLVDVVLVLLIIFLVTMPILMKDISVDVPKKSEDALPADMMPDQITLELKSDGRLFMSGTEVNRTELAEKLRNRLEHKRDKLVFVDFDDSSAYGEAVSIMDTVKGAGATTIALKMKEETPPGGEPGGIPVTPQPSPATP